MTDWQAHAACKGMDTELFFAGGPADPDPYDVRRWACGPCQVRAHCLADAIRLEARNPSARYGVFGGMTAAERERVTREKAGRG